MKKICTKFTDGRKLIVLSKGAQSHNAVHKTLQSCYFWYFGYIPEQTDLKPWYKFKVLSKVCMHPKNQSSQKVRGFLIL